MEIQRMRPRLAFQVHKITMWGLPGAIILVAGIWGGWNRVFVASVALFMFVSIYFVDKKRLKFAVCPHCDGSIKMHVNWTCPFCNNIQGRDRSIIEKCVHCSREIDTAFCEHCHNEINL